jgi:hypothetical protein
MGQILCHTRLGTRELVVLRQELGHMSHGGNLWSELYSKRDGVATIAWSLHNAVAPVNLHFLRAFLLPDPDTLHAFIMSSVPDGTKSVLVNGMGFPVTIIHTWEKWMRVHSLRAQWNKSKRWLMQASSPLGDS